MSIFITGARAFLQAVVGGNVHFQTPYGKRRLVYADWAASGRALAPVEESLRCASEPAWLRWFSLHLACSLSASDPPVSAECAR